MVACHECGEQTERPMLKKYCLACYWRLKRAAERDCGLPELHGQGKLRRCPLCSSYTALSSAHGDMPPKRRYLELYKAHPRCALTGHVFDPASDPEQLLPVCVRVDPALGYAEGNLAFVVRLFANSMRNGHSTYAECTRAVETLGLKCVWHRADDCH